MANRIVTVGTGKTYSTLIAAVAGEPDFSESDDHIVFVLDAGAYPGKFTLSDAAFAASTSAAHQIIIRSATGAGHNLTRNTGVRLITSDEWQALFIDIPYVLFQDIAFTATVSNNIEFACGAAASNITFLNCFVYDSPKQGIVATDYGSGSPYAKFINCVAVNCAEGGLGSDYDSDSLTDLLVYNCTAINCGWGFRGSGYATTYFKNSYAGGCTHDFPDAVDPATYDIANCYTTDGGQGTSVISLANAKFVSTVKGSEDVHIQAGSSLIGIGADLQSDPHYPVTTDFAGDSRSATPCVGADEYVAPAPPDEPPVEPPVEPPAEPSVPAIENTVRTPSLLVQNDRHIVPVLINADHWGEPGIPDNTVWYTI